MIRMPCRCFITSLLLCRWPKQERGPNGEAPEFLGAWGGEAPAYDRIPVTHFWRTTVELWPPTSPTSPSAEATTSPSSTSSSSSSSSADSSSYPRVTSHTPWPNAELCVEHPKVHPQHECGLTGLGEGGVESGDSASHYRPAPRFAYMSCRYREVGSVGVDSFRPSAC